MENALDVDNLDEALDEFFDREPVNHNFAIDHRGKKAKFNTEQQLSTWHVLGQNKQLVQYCES